MSDHDLRHLDDAGSGVPAILRSALGAARAASPDDAQLARLAAKLPFGTPPPPPAPPAGPAGPAASGAAAATPSVLLGALIGAALGVVVSAGGLFWPSTHAPPPPPAVATVPLPAARVEALPAPPEPSASVSAAPSVASRPVAVPASASAAAAPSAEEAAPPGPGPGVGVVAPENENENEKESEAHLLERAQDALGPSPAQALALTSEHASRFPGGALGQEREAVAVQALLRLGRTDEARARVVRFVAAFPGSAHRRRLEALVGE